LFREFNSFDGLFEGINNSFTNNKERIESGEDENSDWERRSFRSDDGLYSYTIITRNSKPHQTKKNWSL